MRQRCDVCGQVDAAELDAQLAERQRELDAFDKARADARKSQQVARPVATII